MRTLRQPPLLLIVLLATCTPALAEPSLQIIENWMVPGFYRSLNVSGDGSTVVSYEGGNNLKVWSAPTGW